jgi:hypothetical protein
MPAEACKLHAEVQPWNTDTTHFILLLEHLEHGARYLVDAVEVHIELIFLREATGVLRYHEVGSVLYLHALVLGWMVYDAPELYFILFALVWSYDFCLLFVRLLESNG